MNFISRIKLAKKLPAIMIAFTVLTIAISNFASYENASKALLSEAEDALLTVAESKGIELESWFDGMNVDLLSQAENPTVLSAVRGFGESWDAIDGSSSDYLRDWYIDNNPNDASQRGELEYASDGSAYSQVHKLYHSYFRKLAQEKGYYDVFLISLTGDVIYSVTKEQDYATNLLDGAYSNSNLADAVGRALKTNEPQAFFADFEAYAPSNGAPAAFFATPVLDRRGEPRGIMAIQLATARIDAVTTRATGLGQTGDSFLVAQDMKLRSNPIQDKGRGILDEATAQDAARAALAGEAGITRATEVNRETGIENEYLVAYVPLNDHGVTWGLIVQQSIDEILEPAQALAKTIAIQGLIMIAIVAVLAFFVARAISNPLSRVGEAMRTVAHGDYNVEVPSTERGDEIGQIANALDEFRHALSDAEEATADGLFKGAAFEGSSASLMMIDQEFNIIYMNSSLQKLYNDNVEVFRELYPDFNPDDMVGKNIDVFHKNPAHNRAILSDPNNLPYSTDIKVGDLHFSLDVNTVSDHEGNQIGCVMEWKDVTAMRTNEAVITALDENQAKAEFAVDGSLLRSNGNFAHMLGAEPETLVGRSQNELFAFDPHMAQEHGAVWDRVMRGDSVTGRFKMLDDNGNTSVLDGTFSAVKDSSGRPFRVILIGSDVTESQAALVIAEAERERMKAEQDQVVEGLRVGLKRLANGDLTTRIDEKFAEEYETLRADFNGAIDNLLNAMRNVVENADMIRGEASEISTAADDLSRRTEKQAATLEETATALDQLTSSVRSAAEGAKQASDMVDTAKANAEASGKVVQEAVEAMGQIETSSNQITKITSVIDDIAFQTNLLALNAGVEAARAGEAGRGFAVVASEVRALAQRSSEAAREINELISKSGTLVKRGVGLVGETGEALRGIVTSVTEISTNVGEIAVSSREQSSGLAEINEAVNQLDQVTQQNAAMFEETTAASHALTREAENLSVTTSKFSIGAMQGAASSATPVQVDFKKKAANAPKAAATPSAAKAPAAPATPPVDREPVKQAVNAPAMPSAPPAVEDDWEDF